MAGPSISVLLLAARKRIKALIANRVKVQKIQIVLWLRSARDAAAQCSGLLNAPQN